MAATDIGTYIWESRYRWSEADTPRDRSIADMWDRVARATAEVEGKDADRWQTRFREILDDFQFIPGGRILAGAGTGRQVTLFNCFVMGLIEDDMSAIFESLREAALTMQAGGGVGYDFSTLRPSGIEARRSGNIASGPVSFMQVWNAMCDTLLSTGSRRGAMIATLRCDHPDIERFIDAKRAPGVLERFNLSVQVTDDFMNAVDRGEDWPLVYPAATIREAERPDETVLRAWPGYDEPVPCAVLKRCPARDLWNKLMRAAYDTAEPGVLFVDRINEWNNLGYREYLSCTNPCGEVPLPPYGACNLGSINLTKFVRSPFTPEAHVDLEGIRTTTAVAVRFLDNVIDCSRFPLSRQREIAQGSRRMGLGMTGLGDALIMLGLPYGTPRARAEAESVMRTICLAAYETSTRLAELKGSFPWFDKAAYLKRPFVRALPESLQEQILARGIRNSHLLAIAPAGTISLLAGNVSSGIEPVFADRISRTVLGTRQQKTRFELEDYACSLWRGRTDDPHSLPPAFVTAWDLEPEDHLLMQQVLQKHVDNSISKTINIPEAFGFESFKDLYRMAHEKGLKGCTTFRPNPYRGQILTQERDPTCKPLTC